MVVLDARKGNERSPVKRKIIGFRQDEKGDWVAKLDCGHQQHVRHTPPWINHPWVLTEEGRRQRVGAELECSECEPRAAAAAAMQLPCCCAACGIAPAAWRRMTSAPEEAADDAVCFLTNKDFADAVQYCAACFERLVPSRDRKRGRAWVRMHEPPQSGA